MLRVQPKFQHHRPLQDRKTQELPRPSKIPPGHSQGRCKKALRAHGRISFCSAPVNQRPLRSNNPGLSKDPTNLRDTTPLHAVILVP